MLKLVKRSVLRATRRVGLHGAVSSSRWRRRRLLILCYHGIARKDEHRWRPSLFLHPSLFRERMAAIRDGGFQVLPLTEGLRRMQEGTLPPKSLAITFDDGEVGFFTHAHPILQEYGFSVTVYLTTHYVEHRLPVVTIALSYLLWSASRHISGAKLPHLGRCELDVASPQAREDAYYRLIQRMQRKGLDSEAKNEVLRALAQALGVDWKRFREERRMELMSPAEVEELAELGVDFQLHTHRHRVPEDREEFLRELSDNRQALRRYTGRGAEHFCYPSGQYNNRVIRWLRQAEIVSATTCDPGFATPRSEPLRLPRLVDVPTLDTVEFESWLSGLAAGLPTRPTSRA